MKIVIVLKYELQEKQLDISQFSTDRKSGLHFECNHDSNIFESTV